MLENVFATKLVSARKMASLYIQQLADKLGISVSKQALNKYEQGKMKPESAGLITLANALNVSVDYFYSISTIKVELEDIDCIKYVSKLSKLGTIR